MTLLSCLGNDAASGLALVACFGRTGNIGYRVGGRLYTQICATTNVSGSVSSKRERTDIDHLRSAPRSIWRGPSRGSWRSTDRWQLREEV